MTTLISVYNSEGCVGRCDARCYNAENAQYFKFDVAQAKQELQASKYGTADKPFDIIPDQTSRWTL